MEGSEAQNTTTKGTTRLISALIVLVLGAIIGYFVSATNALDSRFPFKLGLDLAGGSHLVYEADVSSVAEGEVRDAMNVLRDVIERRVNIFGVSEPIVQVERSSVVSGTPRERLVVELPGVADVEEAVAAIGETPLLEFKLVSGEASAGSVGEDGTLTLDLGARYIDTELTGRYLERAELVFGQAQGGLANEPIVQVTFDDTGREIFADLTTAHVGEQIAIFLDGQSISEPVVQEPITGGVATISGNFTPLEARELVRNLNFGALPVPITLERTQTIGASLGVEVLDRGITAGMVGLALVIAFMLFWYRLPGVVASVALLIYIASMLALFKLIPVTLTAAGLAGFILSIGMAVDANVLVFGRMKEEYEAGKNSTDAAREGFKRAWSAIRDSNTTSILSAVVLFWFGTSIVKGFALVFGVGVLISMLSAITVTRTLLLALPSAEREENTTLARLFNSGISK